jgi:hypothetical protein
MLAHAPDESGDSDGDILGDSDGDASSDSDGDDSGHDETSVGLEGVLSRAEALGLLSEADVDRLTDAIATGAKTEGEVQAEWQGRIAAATADHSDR